ncbi:unnamed protein product [Soboliphyme baturini]|uniref:arginine--tRNA ligase n=1 Tax=Soboliphyme baturini TaxID=241478 RepID=A0A183J481_9BILA|nr:unnamed protein product [Soboliphyme baturini]
MLPDEREYKLAKTILKWNDVLLSVLEAFYVHYLCDYLYQLACTFTEFYDGCYCIERNSSGDIVNIRMERMVLCEMTADVLAVGLGILGIRTIEKM